jgi:hypothetical protein
VEALTETCKAPTVFQALFRAEPFAKEGVVVIGALQ